MLCLVQIDQKTMTGTADFGDRTYGFEFKALSYGALHPSRFTVHNMTRDGKRAQNPERGALIEKAIANAWVREPLPAKETAMPDFPALPDDARAALEAFADKYAKVEGGWKEHLTILWATGGDTQEPGGGLLRSIRNTYGPTWLIETYAALWRPHLPSYELARWEDGRLKPADFDHSVLWSGKSSPPAVGDSVRVTVNRIGEAVVTGYFVEDKWLGVIVRKPDGDLVHVFGVDLAEKVSPA